MNRLLIFILLFLCLPNIKYDEINDLTLKNINVEIKGEVDNPGIYEIENNTTIDGLLKKVKLLENADLSKLNLNYKLTNNDVIVIPKFQDNLISINTGTLEELCELNGIGVALANRIIDYRNNQGYFQTLEELKNIKGIKDNVFNKIVNNICL